jgi:hypothetical protein
LDRPVDSAMSEDRPEKITMRILWVEIVKVISEQFPDSRVPWYLTLSGAEGRDIQMLIEQDLISLTEVNSIVLKHQNKIVAVESSNRAILSLQKKFIGLRIKEVDFGCLVRGDSPLAWPEGEDEEFCRAHVINLDLNAPLHSEYRGKQIVFPTLEWIKKLCTLHAYPQPMDWTLCLTLHAEATWNEDINKYIQHFLLDNIKREQVFADRCQKFFGKDLYNKLISNMDLDFKLFGRSEKQKLLMVIVPKIIARLVHNDGWNVKTEYNLCYGSQGHAPMVTWIMKFGWNRQTTATPDTLYRAALYEIFSKAGLVMENGNIEKFTF